MRVPAFITGGLHDIFQRGTPLLYEEIKRQGVTAKLLIGNWTHGNFGSGLPADGVPSLDSIALRWFDHYLKGIDTQVEEIPDVTQYVLGEGRLRCSRTGPTPAAARSVITCGRGAPYLWSLLTAGERADSMLQIPVSGLYSGSTNQWLIGMPEMIIPFEIDNRLTEVTELTYTTPVLEEDLKISGPIAASLYVKTTAREAILCVRVTDVAPNGASRELTAGLLTASLRQIDEQRSRYLDGEIIQPWHPYTREAVLPVNPGETMLMQVEIFPTNAVIKAGHRLRISIGPSDFPHAISPLPTLLKQLLGVVSIMHDEEHPSFVTLPVYDPLKAEPLPPVLVTGVSLDRNELALKVGDEPSTAKG